MSAPVVEPAAPPTRRCYTLALLKGRALVPETRALLKTWEPGESAASLAARTLREDILGRATARRALDIVQVFARRLLQPTDAPARHLKPLTRAGTGAPRQIFSDLLFYYVARQDDLLWDFTVKRYWPAVREGRLTIANREVADLIWEAEQDGRIARSWSAESKRELVGRVLGTLSDFGLLEPLKPGRRKVAQYRVADGTVLSLAHLLHEQGVPDGLLADQPPWSLFGLAPDDVWGRLELLAGDGWLVVQRAGQVARVTWKYAHAEDVSHALAGS
jgi:hypothetical protein